MSDRRYALTEYTTVEGEEPCDHPELKPGLDASICPVCGKSWIRPRTPHRERPKPAPALDIAQSVVVPVKAISPPKRERPRTRPRSKPLPAQKSVEGITFNYAITLKRPWAYAITHLGKDVENRNWRCFLKPGEWVAIHAGKGYVFDDAGWIEEVFDVTVPDPQDHPTGIVAIARFDGNVTESKSRWRNSDKFAWQLSEVRALIDPVDCAGKQRLWKPDDEIKNKVYEGLRVPSHEPRKKAPSSKRCTS